MNRLYHIINMYKIVNLVRNIMIISFYNLFLFNKPFNAKKTAKTVEGKNNWI